MTIYPLIDRPECEVTWEPQYGVPVLHLKLKTKWTVSLKKRFLAGLYFLREMFGDEGFEHIYVNAPYADNKLLKFHISLGFEPWKYLDDADGNHLFVISRQPTVNRSI